MTIEVTCRTEGCENRGVAITMPSGPAVHCGPCGALLADADPAYPPPAAAIPDDVAQLAQRVAALEQRVGPPAGGGTTTPTRPPVRTA